MHNHMCTVFMCHNMPVSLAHAGGTDLYEWICLDGITANRARTLAAMGIVAHGLHT